MHWWWLLLSSLYSGCVSEGFLLVWRMVVRLPPVGFSVGAVSTGLGWITGYEL